MNAAERRQYMQARKRDRQERIQALKVELGCVDCGYNEHPEALDFDHLDGSTKKFKISSGLTRSWGNILAELAKCEVRCANCHRVKTAQRRS